MATYVSLRYIGKKPSAVDNIAHSRVTWDGYGDTQMVTDAQAKMLLKFPDQWELDNPEDQAIVDAPQSIVAIDEDGDPVVIDPADVALDPVGGAERRAASLDGLSRPQRLGDQQWADVLSAGTQPSAPHQTDKHSAAILLTKAVRPLALAAHLDGSTATPGRIRRVFVRQNSNASWGFKFAGGSDSALGGLFVQEVFGANAAQLHSGDRVLSVNDHSALHCREAEVPQLFDVREPTVAMVVLRPLHKLGSSTAPPAAQHHAAAAPSSASQPTAEFKPAAAPLAGTPLSVAVHFVELSEAEAKSDIVLMRNAGGAVVVQHSATASLQAGDRLIAIGSRGVLTQSADAAQRMLSEQRHGVNVTLLRDDSGAPAGDSSIALPLKATATAGLMSQLTAGKLETVVLKRDEHGRFGISLSKTHFPCTFILQVDERYASGDQAPTIGDRVLELNGTSLVFSDSAEFARQLQTVAGSTATVLVQRLGSTQFDQLLVATTPPTKGSFRASAKKAPFSVPIIDASAAADVMRTPISSDPRSPGTRQLGFAFPEVSGESDTDQPARSAVARQLGSIAHVSVSRLPTGTLGVSLASIKDQYGVYVSERVDTSDLLVGDLVLLVDDKFVLPLDQNELARFIKTCADPIKFTVLRLARSHAKPSGTGPFAFEQLTDVLRINLSKAAESSVSLCARDGSDGVFVRDNFAGFRTNDRILSVNGVPMLDKSLLEVTACLDSAPEQSAVFVVRYRDANGPAAEAPRRSSLRQVSTAAPNVPVIQRVRFSFPRMSIIAVQTVSTRKSVLGVFSRKIKPRVFMVQKPCGFALIGSHEAMDGLFVSSVQAGSSADKMHKIKVGDRILAIHGLDTKQIRFRLSVPLPSRSLTRSAEEASELLANTPASFELTLVEDKVSWKAFCRDNPQFAR